MFVMMLSTVTILSSCSGDDDEDLASKYTTTLIGKWVVTVGDSPYIYAYVVTFNQDKTALIEEYKDYEKNGLSQKNDECKVTWTVNNTEIVFEGGKAWFAFGYSPVSLVSVSQNSMIGSQWFKDSNVKFSRLQ